MDPNQPVPNNVKFYNIRHKSSAYDCGTQLANTLKKNEGFIKWFTSSNQDWNRNGFNDYESLQGYMESYQPGITEEIQGFSDALGVSPKKIVYWLYSFETSNGNCSQICVHKEHSTNGHVLVGRSYEWNTDEDRILHQTNITGRNAHIGFTCLLFGRFDGINEHGLFVSMSGAGIFGVPVNQVAPSHFVAIRTLLENCKTVNECIERLDEMPIGGYFNLLLADSRNDSAIYSYADGVKASLKRTDEPYMYTLNHYKLPEVTSFNRLNKGIIRHSRKRAKLINRALGDPVSFEQVKDLFSSVHPDGLCNHFYSGRFGTLWSNLYDLTERKMLVCFGAPSHNSYREHSFHDKPGVYEYSVNIPDREWRE